MEGPDYRYMTARARGKAEGLSWDLSRWTADELLGFAHGLEDAAYAIHCLSNRKRDDEERSEFERLMAL